MLQSQEYVGLLIGAARRSLRHAVQERVTPLRLNPPQFWMLLAVADMSGCSRRRREREAAMRRWILAALCILLVVGAIWFVRRSGRQQPAAAAAAQAQQRPVPVVTAQVQQRDLPIYLDGLGTVIAAKTITVRPQVDGRL